MKVKRWMKSLETQRLLWMMTVVLCLMAAPAWADIQQAMQTLRGKVVDVASGEPMPGVTLRISDMEGVATVSDADGQFQFVGIPVGRHTLEATFLGYDPVTIKELLLSSGKQTVVQVTMRECVSELDEVVVRPKTNKQQPLNEMAQVGRTSKNVFGINGRITLMGGDRYTPLAADVKAEDIMQLPDKTVPEDGANPYTCHKGLNVGFAFSVKYTLNGKRCAHHFVLEYLKMRSYHGQTVELGTNAIVDEFTSLTFPNVAYRIDF